VNDIRVIPITGMPEVTPGDDLAELIVNAAGRLMAVDDVLVVAHKVVSKAEGRLADAGDRRAAAIGESVRILRRSGDMIISETRHGFVCANAGVDASNVPGEQIALLPLDPDLSARRLRARIRNLADLDIAVIISDTFGRAWRLGQTNVAIGVAGLKPFVDYRGAVDAQGHKLTATRICIADEIAGAAEMVMGKREQICAALVRGVTGRRGAGAAAEIVRPASEDLFR
jgi:coenzyme F420-0:L-glutamate ligase/coenzyme F420-1:gamma-L-glutamate ligase